MKEIELTRGYVALVDDEDFDKLRGYRWHVVMPKPGKVYATTAWREGSKVHHRMMHRMILGVTLFSIKVDHRDRNGLNNQRYNLRVSTNAQNLANSLPRPGRTFKGVCLVDGRWRATIGHDYLGTYPTPNEAALAYNAAAIIRWGAFAVLNQV